MNRVRSFGALAAVVVSFYACSASGPNSIAPGVPPLVQDAMRPNDVVGGGHHHNMLSIRLGDVALPNGANLTQVNLGIDAIYVTDPAGTRVDVAQYTSPHVVNVLAYQNGTTTPIGSGSVPTTTYSSMTIIVDTKSSSVLTAAGAKYALSFRSLADASSAGFGNTTTTVAASSSSSTVALTFSRSFTVAQTGQQNFDVDFNAFESLVPAVASASQWTARASLSIAQQGFEGMIQGQVVNGSSHAVRNAVIVAKDASGHAVASTFTDSSGSFLLHTLAGGTYTLTVYNAYTTASGWHIVATGNTKASASFLGPANVRVLPGLTAFVGTIAD